jgi:hypothetical protein
MLDAPFFSFGLSSTFLLSKTKAVTKSSQRSRVNVFLKEETKHKVRVPGLEPIVKIPEPWDQSPKFSKEVF